MKIVRWLLLSVLIGLGLARAIGYLVYAVVTLPSPLETYHLEAKMVLLAYRAEAGLDLYPAWRDYPHVTNFYGPVYFGAIGLIGRATGADIPGLFWIGRLVSFGSGLLATLIVGMIAARRYGRAAGIAGGILGLGVAPMFGFSVMTRPDLAAELLAAVGFFWAVGSSGATRFLGGAVLVVAMLTKQTTAIFLGAASLAWVVEGHWRRGFGLGLGGAVGLGVVVGGVTLLVEPTFAGSLLGEGKAPWNFASWVLTTGRLASWSPDLLFFPALGLVLWASGATGRREVPAAVLAAILLATSVVTAAKLGSDVNYYLNLRVVEILSVGALWQAWSVATTRLRSAAFLLAAVLGCLTVAPGALFNVVSAQGAWQTAQIFKTPGGRGRISFQRELNAMAADPTSRLLTDSGLIELYEGDRAAFGDPFLFRVMVNTGRIDPTLMRERIDSQYYTLVITTHDIQGSSYDTYDFGLPKTLADRVRSRYVRLEYQGGLFFYGRRPEPTASPRPDTAEGSSTRPGPP